jgi:transcriptional regulator with XRE-family HTH domain/predicted negative regulator of RcsB-dependent stress response
VGEGEQTESVGQRVRRLRIERGLSQRDLSGPGVSYAYISRIEAGYRSPSLKAMRMLARRLGVSLDYLETGIRTPQSVARDLKLSDAEIKLRLETDREDVEETLRSVLREAVPAGDEWSEMRARTGLGLALVADGKYSEAIGHLQAVIDSGAITLLSRPDVYATLGRALVALGRQGDAVALFRRCLDDLARQSPKDSAIEFRFRTYLSCALADAGNLPEARRVVLEVMARAEKIGDATARVQLYWSLARVASMAGEAVQAMSYMRRAISLLEASEDTRELAVAHLHCSQILLLADEPEEAAPHLEKAEHLLSVGADNRDLGALRAQQARLAIERDDADEGVERANQALDLLAEHQVAQGAAWHALGDALALKGKVDEAVSAFERASQQLEGSGEWRELVAVYKSWSRCLREAGRAEAALDVMERASAISIRHAEEDARRASGAPARETAS